MNNYKGLTIWTLIANSCIMIAVGHGAGPIGLLEIVSFSNLIGIDDSFSPSTLIESALLWIFIINLAAQLLTLIQIIGSRRKKLLLIAGVSTLILNLVALLTFLWSESTFTITLISSLPFVILASVLFYRVSKRQTVVNEETF